MTIEGEGLERALARTEEELASAERVVSGLLRDLKKAKKAAAEGNVRDLEKGLDSTEELGAAVREAVRASRASWRLDVRSHMESGAYSAELIKEARGAGVPLEEQEGRLVCFPSVVRVVATDCAIEVDKKRQRGIRPSAVLAGLRAARERPVRFRPEPFLEALLQAYRLVLAQEGRELRATVKLFDVYRALTLLPGAAASYTKPEFARDLSLLEESEVRRTKEGLKLFLPAATGTKGTQTLTTVTRDGRLRVYYGLAFEP